MVRRRGGNGPGSAPTGPAVDAARGRSWASSPSSSSRSSSAGGWFLWQLHPPGGEGAGVTVEIKPGWGTKEAGDELQSRGVIGSSLAFQVW